MLTQLTHLCGKTRAEGAEGATEGALDSPLGATDKGWLIKKICVMEVWVQIVAFNLCRQR